MHTPRPRVGSAHVIAIAALFVALGGIAVALDRNSVGSRHIRDNAVAFKDLKGVKAWNKRVPVSAESSTTGAALDNADVVRLAKRGSITLFGKCARNTTTDLVVGGAFARTRAPGAMYRTGANLASSFSPGAPAAMPGFAYAANNTITFAEAQYDNVVIIAAAHKLALSAVVHVGAKNGSPAIGSGPFGPGDGCSFSGSLIG